MCDVLIVTPFFNSFSSFTETFLSVVGQTYKNFQWIIIDDGSSIGEKKKLLQLVSSDKRVNVIVNEKNLGAGPARNIGLNRFAHQYLSFIDSDDIWDKDFLEKMILFQKASNARVVFSGYRRFVKDSHEFIKPYNFSGPVGAEEILKGNPISCLSALIKPDPDLELPIFGSQVMRNDLVFFYRALKLYGDAIGTESILATYVMRSNSLSRNKFKLIKWQWAVYRYEVGYSYLKSLWCLINWAAYGYLKYRK